MKRMTINGKRIFAFSISMGVIALCMLYVTCDAKSLLVKADGTLVTNEVEKVDFDFTRMNPTLRMTHTYRLAAKPDEFVGKTLRLSGTFLTRVDEGDGKRYFGCLMGDSAGCSCCAPGGVLEFVPKDSYVWPTNFPPVESRITITGRLDLFAVGDNERREPVYLVPRLVDVEISPSRQ